MAFRYPSAGTYTFSANTASDVGAFLYTDPVATSAAAPQASGTTRRWCHHTATTPSVGVGPDGGSGGVGDGFLYTEASSPAAANDVFIVELDQTLDASANSVVVSFKYNQRGDTNTSDIEAVAKEGAGTWTSYGTTNFGGSQDISTGGISTWRDATVDFTGLISDASTRVGVRVTFPSSGTIWHNDVGIDDIAVVGTALFERVQEGYRWRNDDDGESTASWLAAQDTTATTIATGNNRRLRILTDYTGGDPDAEAVTLEYKEEGDNTSEWRAVPLTA